MSNFNKKLEEGHKGEKILYNLLNKELKGYNIIMKMEKDKEKDIVCQCIFGDIIKIEVKYCGNINEKANLPYNNIILESKCRGKKSGILTTDADIWCQINKNDNSIHLYKTIELKELLLSFKYKEVYLKDTDGNPYGYLVPMAHAKEYSIKEIF